MRDEFTMKLEPKDDQPGYVVAEFRVNGDGWHHYYGWPDAPAGHAVQIHRARHDHQGTGLREPERGRALAAAVGNARTRVGHASDRVPCDRCGRQYRAREDVSGDPDARKRNAAQP